MTKNVDVGLSEDMVRLAAYSAEWPRLFAVEAKNLKRHLRGTALDIQHIGSTAVRGLTAKPIIDIAIQVRGVARMRRIRVALEATDYVYEGEFGLAGRHFFVKGDPIAYHVHVVDRTSHHWDRWLKFRDYLRLNPESQKAYVAFKKKLARKFARDRGAYTQGKNPFINKALKASS